MIAEALPILCAGLLAVAICLICLPSSLWARLIDSQRDHAVMVQVQQGRLSVREKLARRLRQSQSNVTLGQYALIGAFSGMAFYLLCGMVLQSWWMPIPALFAGIIFSERVIGYKSAKHKERFEAGNLRAVRIMASSLRTSPSYLMAFEQVAYHAFVEKRVAREYLRVVELLRGQVPLDKAMADFYARTGSADISYLSTIVQVQRELGGDMAKTLDQAAGAILRRKQLLRKQRAAMSQILAQVNLLSAMPFVFVATLFLNNPHHFDPLLATISGRFLILGAFLMILLGGELIRFIALKQAYRGG
ncbi:UNVERIFIED_CONTAM: tight adherence protein B [Brevibacillus sp. OAP136]